MHFLFIQSLITGVPQLQKWSKPYGAEILLHHDSLHACIGSVQYVQSSSGLGHFGKNLNMDLRVRSGQISDLDLNLDSPGPNLGLAIKNQIFIRIHICINGGRMVGEDMELLSSQGSQY